MAQATAPVPRRRRSVIEERLLQAFATIRSELLHTLALILGSPEDAQDALQETFLKCWQARQRSAGVNNLRAWLFRIAINTARDLQRSAWRRKARPLLPQISPDDRAENGPPERLLHGESLERLRLALSDLRPEEREIFLLRQNSDMTYDQIADLRQAPVGTVKTQMRSALHKLRAVLQVENRQ